MIDRPSVLYMNTSHPAPKKAANPDLLVALNIMLARLANPVRIVR